MTGPLPPDQNDRAGRRSRPTPQRRQRRRSPPPDRYSGVEEFFDSALSVMYARNIERTDHKWCKQWQQHPEARARLRALWRLYEQCARDDTMIAWWDAADKMMRELLDAQGTFTQCTDSTHNAPPPL